MTSTARERRRTSLFLTLRHHRWTRPLVVASVVILLSAGAIIALNAADNMAPPRADVDCSDAVRHDIDEARLVADGWSVRGQVSGAVGPVGLSGYLGVGEGNPVVGGGFVSGLKFGVSGWIVKEWSWK